MSDEIHEFRMDIKELDIPVFWGHISGKISSHTSQKIILI